MSGNPRKLRKTVLITTAGIVLVIVLLMMLRPNRGVTQPIAFNHKLHAGELQLDCSHCHTGVENGPFATLPKSEICLSCHAASLSENPEEAKVRNYGEDQEIPWQRLTRQPDHVYFSHQRHVKLGQITCEICHGKMAERSRPPEAAPMELSMDDCLECHRQKGASEDCISCHR